ncbi:MAG: DUF2088 domain-containing protein, partial [Planctomycetaceae bacterium]|nr:DUF2088 domain-containing protein [Planctomycetaceae bacterium]
MTLFYGEGSAETSISADEMRTVLVQVFQTLGARNKVLAIPPDFTRFHSRAGALTSMTYEYYQDKLVDIMPALGTHVPMPAWQLDKMFEGVPHELFREHRWRDDVLTVGQVPAEFVSQVTAGIWEKPWPAQMNKLVFEGGHDLILSIGQVVPHEVIGMANYNKNIFVGTGGV